MIAQRSRGETSQTTSDSPEAGRTPVSMPARQYTIVLMSSSTPGFLPTEDSFHAPITGQRAHTRDFQHKEPLSHLSSLKLSTSFTLTWRRRAALVIVQPSRLGEPRIISTSPVAGRTVSIAKLLEEIKSRLLALDQNQGAVLFRVSRGKTDTERSESVSRNWKTSRPYIWNQREHHRVRTFQEEYRDLLAKYEVPYYERYVWD